jgi:uncharacterized membrane protein
MSLAKNTSIGQAPIAERSSKGCTTIILGCWLFAFGLIWLAVGYLWHFPQLTRTTGVVTESKPRAYGVIRRGIAYEYFVNGVRYRGERFLWTSSVYPQMYDVGQPFVVYYVTSHPEISYGPLPPQAQTTIVVGYMLVTFGVVCLLWRPGQN